ncbi:hypothetical protein A3736_08675 [Erythrobacter sp. HI0063]|jgi:hypothetical protein|uniref:relaxase/mobilization nuclease domain-containing protein n=1 Tax=Erythrobacter sp. HI0063 TaxID=1822240 RepID=UPI0007C32A27|nr:relaxase/mobilization nuclease domain-containing protein [Erythrobacter sp. HI0063]KZY56333.1 hypothetical protein A3736_08675 [Erythrobacter sp. HI0063]
MIVKSTARKNKLKSKLGIEASRRAMTRAVVAVMEYSTDQDIGFELGVLRQGQEPVPVKHDAFAEETEAQIDEAARTLLAYTLSKKPGEKLRAVRTRSVFGHEDDDIEVEEFTERAVVLMADADPSHLRHVILADPVAGLDQVMIHLRRLYGPAASISLTEHGDTDHRHFHAVILTVNPATGKGFQINKGFDVEALHMLAASIDFENGVYPEPNALFVADEEAIYDRWRGQRVASRSYEVDPAAANSVRHNRLIIMADNEAADHADEGWLRFRAESKGLEIEAPEWDDERVAKLMIAPRIKRAKSWDELHDSLAMIGVRYVDYRGNGRLMLGDDRHIAASAAISTASMTELTGRFRKTFYPPSRPELLRPFICPRFTMKKADKADAEVRRNAKGLVDAEAERIAQLADENLRKMRVKDRHEVNRQIREVARRARADHAKKSKLNENRRKEERAKQNPNPSLRDQAEAIAWQLDIERFDQMIELYSGYARTRYWDTNQWRKQGRLEFIEYRSFITIMKGADKLQALRLAQLKWGEDFKIFGSKRDIAEYCRLAAQEGIVFGDKEQRKRINGFRVGTASSSLDGQPPPHPLWRRIEKLTKALNARDAEGAKRYNDRVVNKVMDANIPKGDRIDTASQLRPNDRRAMIRVQNAPDHRDELVQDYEQPTGQSIAWVQKALDANPEDLSSPRLQGFLMAQYFHQEAERGILLNLIERGEATITDDGVVYKGRRDWPPIALQRENENPVFLRSAVNRGKPKIESTDPDIEAYVLSGEPHTLHDLTIARQELAQRLLKKARKGGKRSTWFHRLDQREQMIVEGAIEMAPDMSPTLVVDETLIKNMTPAQKAFARRHSR